MEDKIIFKVDHAFGKWNVSVGIEEGNTWWSVGLKFDNEQTANEFKKLVQEFVAHHMMNVTT